MKVYWCLDADLAAKRHFPAINWLNSYSLYSARLDGWFAEHVNPEYPQLRAQFMKLLQEEDELNEVVQLVGEEGLSVEDRMKLETCKMIREDYLNQNSFNEFDTYTSLNKQFMMMKMISHFYSEGLAALAQNADFNKIAALPVRETIGRFKYVAEEDVEAQYPVVMKTIEDSMSELISKEEEEE